MIIGILIYTLVGFLISLISYVKVNDQDERLWKVNPLHAILVVLLWPVVAVALIMVVIISLRKGKKIIKRHDRRSQ